MSEFSNNYKLAKWLTPKDFAAAMAVVHGRPYPSSRDELAAWIKTPEGKDAYIAQKVFEKVTLTDALNPPELTFRLVLEAIKKGKENLAKLPVRDHAKVLIAWAKAVTAYVRYSRALQSTMRYRNSLKEQKKRKADELDMVLMNLNFEGREFIEVLKSEGVYDKVVFLAVETAILKSCESNPLIDICLNEPSTSNVYMSTQDAESLLATTEEMVQYLGKLKDESLLRATTNPGRNLALMNKIPQIELENAITSQLTSEWSRVMREVSAGRVPALLVYKMAKGLRMSFLKSWAVAEAMLRESPRLAFTYKHGPQRLATRTFMSSDIFDENLGEDIDEKQDLKSVQTLEEWIKEIGMDHVKWFAVSSFGFNRVVLGTTGSALVIMSLRPNLESATQRWLQVNSQLPINKETGKALQEALNKIVGYEKRWRWNVINKLTDKTVVFKKGGDVSTSDALVMGGVVKQKASKVPTIDLIFDRGTVSNLRSTMESATQKEAVISSIAMSINGRVWEFDPDTVRHLERMRVIQKLRQKVFETETGRSVNKRSINLNRNRSTTGYLSNFCSMVLENMTREDSAFFIALSQAEEFFRQEESKGRG